MGNQPGTIPTNSNNTTNNQQQETSSITPETTTEKRTSPIATNSVNNQQQQSPQHQGSSSSQSSTHQQLQQSVASSLSFSPQNSPPIANEYKTTLINRGLATESFEQINSQDLVTKNHQQQQKEKEMADNTRPNRSSTEERIVAAQTNSQQISKEEAQMTDSIPLEMDPEDIKTGKYLGEGVYSEVYQGSCYGTQVAVKKFKNQGMDPVFLGQVRKEVRIMKSIRHPNLLLFLGACTKPGHLMIVTELLDKSFHDLDDNKFSLFTKLEMAREAAKGISWLHSLSPVIIHRDLKPENILIADNGKIVKVADFGLSLVKDHSKQEAEEMKKIRGSPAFMSPEALQGQVLTPKTDVYSFGMIIWELLTCRSPYEDLEVENLEELIVEICVKKTREKIPEDCVPSLRKLITACWSPEPNQRPDFLHIMSMLDDCLMEAGINDEGGRKFWKSAFADSNGGSIVVETPWESWLLSVSKQLRVSEALKIFSAIKSLLGVREHNKVHIQSFGNLLKWFGPLGVAGSKDNFVERIQDLCQNRWFHGDISQKQAEDLLYAMGDQQGPGCYLVRLSSQPGLYALSKLIRKDNQNVVVHVRISHEKPNNFSFNIDGQDFVFTSLQELVKHPLLGLSSVCPGSKYYAAQRERQFVGGYINAVK